MSILKKAFTCVCCVTFSIMLAASIGCEAKQEPAAGPTEAELEAAFEEMGEALEEAMKDMENLEFEE